MLSRIYTAGLCGIDGMIITIECSTMKRMPVFDIVGLPDASVKESKDRIRSALRQSGYEFPDGEVVINMAPADKKKEGSGYDLPLCVSLLCAGGVIPDAPVLKDSLFLGELSLGGNSSGGIPAGGLSALLGDKQSSADRERLLIALRPYLSDSRSSMLDTVLRLMRLARLGDIGKLIGKL